MDNKKTGGHKKGWLKRLLIAMPARFLKKARFQLLSERAELRIT